MRPQALCLRVQTRAGGRARPETPTRKFRDVVFDDVGFEQNS